MKVVRDMGELWLDLRVTMSMGVYMGRWVKSRWVMGD